ncbi:MAG TPA: hypothetical protein PKA82_06890 [Pyrinomonadaceae bacterium]|nr:hypothetical protein [Pyrinomonadaceae bacterium]
MNLKRLFLYSLIGSVAISALIGIVVLLVGSFDEISVRVLMTTLTVTATSILGLACGAYYETGRNRLLPTIGITVTIIAAVMTLLIVWDIADDSELFVKCAVTAMLLAVSFSHVSLLSLARLDSRFEWTNLAARIVIGALVGLILFLVWIDPEGSGDTLARTMGVLSILTATLTVVTPVLHKLSHAEPGDEAAELDAEIASLKEKLAELEARRANLAEE